MTTATRFLHLRQLTAYKITSSRLSEEVEADESYFGVIDKGKRGRGAGSKVAVFGLLKRGGKVCTVIISNATTETLLPIIGKYLEPDSIVYSDTFGAYNGIENF